MKKIIIVNNSEYAEEIYNIAIETAEDPWTLEMIKEDMKNVLSYYFLYFEDGKILGYLSIWHIITEVEITNICVLKEHQNKGIATKLMKEVLAFAKKNFAIDIYLEVNVNNTKAIKLYEKSGFGVEGIRKEYYAESKEDAYVMRKDIEQCI
ncbi:MAG: ribosomal protein S18-alanine N-acetyltransferase [Lachnospirales bacterium]